jgi:gas vesicle protein
MSLWDFINKYQGKIVTDPWGGYNGQCVSIVKRYISENNWPMKSGNAIQWQNNGDDFYKWIKNTTSAVPSPGDLIVFQIGTYGHIGIVTSANQYTVDVFNQNWPNGNTTDPCIVTRFNYVNPKVVGWLHPKALDVVAPAPAPPEDPNLAKIRELEGIIQTKAQEIQTLIAELNTCKSNLTLNENAAKEWKKKYEEIDVEFDTYREDSADEIDRLTKELKAAKEKAVADLLIKQKKIDQLEQAIKDNDLSNLSFWERIILLFRS